MKAFVVDRYKRKDGMRLAEMPDPEVRPHDVLVRVRAAGVNRLDAKIQQGEFKLILPYRVPFVLGNDVAGEVVRIGPQVTRFKIGDEVYARPAKDRIGTFAELIAVDEHDLAGKPASLTMEQAASLPLVALTAWQALVERANLQPGEKVLIQAGSGGVGTIAIQLAKHLGAYVATTASAANADWLKSLGADEVIDYKTTSFESVLHDYDVVLDSQGKASLTKSLQVLRPGGRLIGIAGPPDAAFGQEIGANAGVRLVMRLLSAHIRRAARPRRVTYSFLFMRASGEQLTEITKLVDAGVIRPFVDRVFPFASVREAVDLVEGGRVKGKVVVVMAG